MLFQFGLASAPKNENAMGLLSLLPFAELTALLLLPLQPAVSSIVPANSAIPHVLGHL
jgi:hypothetical protein